MVFCPGTNQSQCEAANDTLGGTSYAAVEEVTEAAKIFRKFVNDFDVYIVPIIILFGVIGKLE